MPESGRFVKAEDGEDFEFEEIIYCIRKPNIPFDGSFDPFAFQERDGRGK
jgi:hypothetical protein